VRFSAVSCAWSEGLNKQELVANQASLRGGVLYGKMNGRVRISGKAALFSEAMIYIGQ